MTIISATAAAAATSTAEVTIFVIRVAKLIDGKGIVVLTDSGVASKLIRAMSIDAFAEHDQLENRGYSR